MKIRQISFTALFVLSQFITVFGISQNVRSEPNQGDNPSTQNTVGKNTIDDFCAQSTNPPTPGFQFDGKAASSAVMELGLGRYEYPNSSVLLLFPNQYFLLKLPTNRTGIYGTDGDDILFASGIVGGCSLEQLSEAISNNKLAIEDFNLIKSYE